MWDIAIVFDAPVNRTALDLNKEGWKELWCEVYAQGVPGHIDLDVDWLPPPVTKGLRAVVIVHYADSKDGQRYLDPLLVLTGKEYEEIDMYDLLEVLKSRIEVRYIAGTIKGQELVEVE